MKEIWAGYPLVARVVLLVALVLLGIVAVGALPWASFAGWVSKTRGAWQPLATGVSGLAILIAALVTMWWNLRGQKRTREEFERQHEADAIARLRDRYTEAARQLGDDAAAVRLAGVYSMAALADDWLRRKDRPEAQACVNVLCAYLRMPTREDPAEQETRSTIVDTIRTHLTDPESPTAWCPLDFNFSRAVLHRVNLRGATFSGGAVFADARFFGITDFTEVTFLGEPDFTAAKFSGDVHFNAARFFSDAVFLKALFEGTTWFHLVTFAGNTWFGGALFAGVARFDQAVFERASGWENVKAGATFERTVSLKWVEFRS